jgi:hypothetical protein
MERQVPRHPRYSARGSKPALLLVLLTIQWALCGCTYYYNGQEFSTQSRAFAAQKRDHESILAHIEPLPQPLAEHARIGIPVESTIAEEGTIGGGSGRSFVVEILNRSFANTVEAIKRRNLFRYTVVETTRGEHLEPRSGEVVLYYYMTKKAGGWYFKNGRTPRTPLFFELGQPEVHARIAYFLGSLERLLAGAGEQTESSAHLGGARSAPP